MCVPVFAEKAAQTDKTDTWASWLGNNRDSIWTHHEVNLNLNDEPLKLAWKKELGSGYGGPAIDKEFVVVMDWVVDKDATAPGNVFDRGEIKGKESIRCFKVQNGEKVWDVSYPETYTISYPAGPRTTPVITSKYVVSLGAEGKLKVIHKKDGSIAWAKDFKKDYQSKTPLWGHSSHPLVYNEDSLICLVGGSEKRGVICFDINSGEEKWQALNFDEMGYCPPTLINRHEKTELLIWSGDGIYALNPDSGQVLWDIAWKIRYALSIPTPRQHGNLLFLTSFYNGATMIDLNQDIPGIIWQTRKASEKDTQHLNSIMCSPFLQNGYIYGVCSYGQLRCLEAESGKRIWSTQKATTGDEDKLERWANAFIVKNGASNRYLLFNELGDLIDCDLTPDGYMEHGRMNLIEPNGKDLRRRPIVWSHPAVTTKVICVRNDDSIVCFKFPK